MLSALKQQIPKITRFGGGVQFPVTNKVLPELRKLKWNAYPTLVEEINKQMTPTLQQGQLFGRSVARGVTLTPYANAVKCPAHCHYCSEDLQQIHQKHMNSSPKYLINDYSTYFNSFNKLLQTLQSNNITVGLSVSGLEATAEPEWMKQMLNIAGKYPSLFTERVLYTNGAGLVGNPSLINGFNRVEWHRDHHIESTNQLLMRLEQSYDIRINNVLEKTVASASQYCPDIRVVCILSKPGVHSLSEAKEYANGRVKLDLGVIFRELSRLNQQGFKVSTTLNWVKENRVPIDTLYGNEATLPHTVTCGYYYYNEIYSGSQFIDGEEKHDSDKFSVTLEASSYEMLDQVTHSNPNIIHKLEFHSNGNLTTGWSRGEDIVHLGTEW